MEPEPGAFPKRHGFHIFIGFLDLQVEVLRLGNQRWNPLVNEQFDPARFRVWNIGFHAKWLIFGVYVSLPEGNST